MPETGTFLSRDPVESEPPYQYVRGNPVNWADATGMNPPVSNGSATPLHPTGQYPPASIGILYSGDSQPLKNTIIESHGEWRIEDNLYGNNLFQDGVVRFRDYILKIAIPNTTSPMASSQPTIGQPAVSIAPSMYRTILHFQGLMNVASFGYDSIYRIGYSNPGNSQFARPGVPSEYTHIQVSPTGHAFFTGDDLAGDKPINGASPAITSLGELVIITEVDQRHPNGRARNNIHLSGFDPYGVEGFVGNRRAQMVASSVNVLGLLNSFLSTPPIGLRRYQLLLQENQVPLACGLGLRYRILIQTYQLMIYPQADLVNLRSAHLSVSPNGKIKEKPLSTMIYKRQR